MNFRLRCCHCGAVFDDRWIFSHLAGHGIIGDLTNNARNDWLNLNNNVSVVLTYKDCLAMFTEKMRRSYLEFYSQLRMNGVAPEMIPHLETDTFGIGSSLEVRYPNHTIENKSFEISTAVLARLGFTPTNMYSN